MLKTKNGIPLNQLTTKQFAGEILNSPNKIFSFLIKPDDDFCFNLASVDLFGVQTVVVNAGKFINNNVIGCPGCAHAFNITCYDVVMNFAYDWQDCMKDIIEGLEDFRRLNATEDRDGNTWYMVDSDKANILEIIYSWRKQN